MQMTKPIATPGDLWISGLFGREVTQPVRNAVHGALKLGDLDRLYLDARTTTLPGSGFSDRVLRSLDIEVAPDPAGFARFPKTGPVVIVANHPCGIVDGLIMDCLLARVRPDARILANHLVSGVPEMEDRCVPVDVLRAGAEQGNSRSLRKLVRLLRSGGAVAVFPAGEVAHWKASELRVTDPPWNDTAARLIQLTGATVVPIYFPASNGIGFQLAGLVHPLLRTMWLPAELLNKRGHRVEVRIGTPFSAATLDAFPSPSAATEYLRMRTYLLGHRRSINRVSPAAPQSSAPALIQTEDQNVRREAERIIESNGMVIESGNYCVLLERGGNLTALLPEIGRARELTFRAAGEGTGGELDVDRFDTHYSHLILWDREQQRIAGGYRLAWTQDILPLQGARGLYTGTLFKFNPRFFECIGPAVELGRSFIRPEDQRGFQPLLLLWQAISRCVAQRPGSPVLFGAVSVSAAYTEASRALIASFISRHAFDRSLSGLVKPRHRFRPRRVHKADLAILLRNFAELEDLSAPIRDIEEHPGGVPVLIRQYLKVGGRIAAWNVDDKFSSILDGLVVVDLRRTEPRLLDKYMGREQARRFQQFHLAF